MKKIVVILVSCIVLFSCQKDEKQADVSKVEEKKRSESENSSSSCSGCPSAQANATDATEEPESKERAPITFIELGSVNCIPCKKLQPVMKAIEDKYGSQIEVVFYDVWKLEQKKYAQEYKIKLIPT